MIYNNVELHNVEELQPVPGGNGVVLNRFPSRVTEALKGRGSFVSRSATGCEIRFASSATTIWVTLEAMVYDLPITVFCGDFVYKKITVKANTKATIQLDKNQMFGAVGSEFFKSFKQSFNINVWRLHINSVESNCIFHEVSGLDGVVRPPFNGEQPKKTWLAYGSSITHGGGCDDTSNSYIQHTARLLKADVLCKGMSGACCCEKEIANYIAGAKWDFATLELGVNMYGFKTKDFKKRAQYLIETVHEAKPDNKVFVITPYPNYTCFVQDKDSVQKHKDYVDILTEIVTNIHSENVVLINGDDVLEQYTYLSSDMVHPSEFGHSRMGENLYNIMKSKL